MKLDRAAIERCLPHGPTMCLLDAVAQWDATRIHCIASPPSAAHPLARDGVVPAVAAVELAAQAAAIHGALRADDHRPRPGLLAKIGDATLHTDHLPVLRASIDVHVDVRADGPSACLYGFVVRSGGLPIASGRLLIAFVTPPDDA